MQSQFPRKTLEKAVEVAEALWTQYAGDATPPHDVAMATDLSPTSSHWRLLSGSAKAYGLTDAGYGAEEIGLTDLGRKVVAPTEEGERQRGLRQSLLQPEIMRKFYQKYDRKNFPRDEIAQNVLANEFDLPKERTEEAVNVLKANGRYTGVLRDTGSSLFVALDLPSEPENEDAEEETEARAQAKTTDATASTSPSSK
jgi:hypothetical protein